MRVILAASFAGAFFLVSISPLDARLFRRTMLSCSPVSCPNATTRWSESPHRERPALEPLFPNSQTGDALSSPQGTVLEALPGTGSRSPTSLLGPKVVHNIDPATMKEIREILQAKREPQTAAISLPMEAAISERCSRILMILEVLAWLAGATLGSSAIGRLGPLGALLANGLLSVVRPPSRPPATTRVEPSSPAPLR